MEHIYIPIFTRNEKKRKILQISSRIRLAVLDWTFFSLVLDISKLKKKSRHEGEKKARFTSRKPSGARKAKKLHASTLSMVPYERKFYETTQLLNSQHSPLSP